MDVSDAFDVIMRGDASPVQVAALLAGLRVRGETAAVVAGVARALRRAMIGLECDDPEMLVDTCGTGGGAVTTFNISTAAALVAAGAGVKIAKHGNRSFTSKSGSADVLEALGMNIDVEPERMRDALRQAGIVFMYAPRMHPAMRHVGPVRRELAIPTVMNIVGPLANPAGAGRQVIGVADEHRLPIIADALAALGTVHSLIVHGTPGMDEISPLGPTTVIELCHGTTRQWEIQPTEYGFRDIVAEDLAGGDPMDNAALIERMFAGDSRAGARAAVVLNAAAAIYISGASPSYDGAIERAERAIRDGGAAAALNRLRSALP
jgi:anthranilate phosphoribosyltransferase